MKKKTCRGGALCAFAVLILTPGGGGGELPVRPFPVRRADNTVAVPVFVLSILLNRLGLPAMLGRLAAPLGRMLGVSGTGCTALIMGLCGGYPLGAAYIADMHESGAIDQNEAERLSASATPAGLYNRGRGRGRIRIVKGGGASILAYIPARRC